MHDLRRLFLLLGALSLMAVGAVGCDDDDGGEPGDDMDLVGDTGDDTAVDTSVDTDDDTGVDTDDDVADGDTDDDVADGDTDDDVADGDDTTDVEDDVDDDMADADVPPTETMFTVTLTNHSDLGPLATPFSPGAFIVHADGMPIFTPDQPAPDNGLEGLAEDADGAMLTTSLAALTSIDTGALDTGVPPGGSASFSFSTADTAARLSMARMFGQSNDAFITFPADGLPLFDTNGDPISGDLTGTLELWDAGTERDELPFYGLNQAPRQGAPDTGDAEGVVGLWTDTTRAMPIGIQMASVDVADNGDGSFTITVTNVGRDAGVATSPLSPLVWAVHDDSVSLFQSGEAASPGIERVAEDGDPSVLAAAIDGVTGVEMSGVVDTPDGAVSAGPITDGNSYTFTVTPTATARFLNFASMVGQTSDTFIAFDPQGLALLDENGDPRATEDLETDIYRGLKLWDAGTEVNDIPGVGPDQAPRQAAPDTGADEGGVVRVYDDTTNDLDGTTAPLGGFYTLTIEDGVGLVDYTLTLARPDDGFGILASPPVVVLHDGSAMLFTPGMPSSAGLEALAEDGTTALLITELTTAGATATTPLLATMPIGAGESFEIDLTVGAGDTHLNLASMVAPSNDTFMALGELGVELRDGAGDLRAAADIQTDIDAALRAWQAGTERNQAAMIGPDMAGPGLQIAPATGAAEGDGTVSLVAGGEQFGPFYTLTITAQ